LPERREKQEETSIWTKVQSSWPRRESKENGVQTVIRDKRELQDTDETVFQEKKETWDHVERKEIVEPMDHRDHEDHQQNLKEERE